ncbi:MAG: TIM barrel protein [Planctomycetes bacterium]|nr:TIM barrel protein [Planctomycetota bacterium]
MSSIPRRSFLAAGAALPIALPNALQGGEPAKARVYDDRRPLDGVKTNFACNIEMWGFGTNDHAERIRRAADLGFRGVEFWPWRGKDLDALDKARRETGVTIAQFLGWGFSPGLNESKNHEAFVQEIEAGCEAAKRLEVTKMLVIAGQDVPGLTKAEMHQNVADGLKRAVPVLEQHDIMLVLEPLNRRRDHKGHCLNNSPDAIAICKQVGSKHVKIAWDLYHLQIDEGDLCGRMREGFDEIGYFQFADHPGRHEPGTGEISYARVFKEAHDLGYTGWFGAECSPLEGERKAAERLAATDRG